MKKISYDFYWKFNKNNILQIVELIKNKSFPLIPHELIYQNDCSFEEGIKDFALIDFDQQETVSVIINGHSKEFHNQQDRLFFTVDNWGSDRIIKLALSCHASTNMSISFIQSYLKISELICCFIYDTEDELWQTESSLNFYELNGKDYSNLPKTIDRAGRAIIDTSLNYGRSKYSIRIKFIAAGEMYFGELFFKIISKNTFLSFVKTKQIQIGNNCLFYLKLFDLFNDDVSTIRRCQEEFVETTQIIKIAENLNENYRGVLNALNSLGIQ